MTDQDREVEKSIAMRLHAVRPDGGTLAEILKKNIEEQEADNEPNDPEH